MKRGRRGSMWDEPALDLPHGALESEAFVIARRFEAAFRREPADGRQPPRPDLLAWGRKYLPHYFTRAPSQMHRWLAERLAAAEQTRGVKLNVVGPRGGAKSTVGTLAWVLRMIVERREPYVWIVSDTKLQAQAHLENLKRELEDNGRWPKIIRRVAGATACGGPGGSKRAADRSSRRPARACGCAAGGGARIGRR